MNLPCETIQDLLPLYHDKVCNPESRKLVEEHIKECSQCAKLLQDLSVEMERRPDDCLNEAKPLKAMERRWKKDKKKSFIKGAFLPIAICGLLAIVFVLLTQWYIVPIPTNELELVDVAMLSNGDVIFKLKRRDDQLLSNGIIRYDGDTAYYTPRQTVIGKEKKVNTFWYNWMSNFMKEGITKVYIGTPKDCILLWEEGIELPIANEELEQGYVYNVFQNLLITNESQASISSIYIYTEDEAKGVGTIGMESRTSPYIEKGPQSFHMDAMQDCYFLVVVSNPEEQGGIALAWKVFTKDFSYIEGEEIQLYIRDDESGNVYITDVKD